MPPSAPLCQLPPSGDENSTLPAPGGSTGLSHSCEGSLSFREAPAPITAPLSSLPPCPCPHQAGDLAGEQKGSGIFQQLLLVPNFLLAGLGEANPCGGGGQRHEPGRWADRPTNTGALEVHSPGEKMSGLKRTSKAVLLMEPTALHALRITSRLRGSAVETQPAGRQPHSPTAGAVARASPGLGLPLQPQQPHLSHHPKRWSPPAPSP